MAQKKVDDDDVRYYKRGKGGKARTVRVKAHAAHYGKNRHVVHVHKYMRSKGTGKAKAKVKGAFLAKSGNRHVAVPKTKKTNKRSGPYGLRPRK
jgi:acyl-coenzyme A thioesterase PaaI-like protein